MSEFEPTTDFPGSIDPATEPVESRAKIRDQAVQRRRRHILRWLTLGAGLALLASGFSTWRVIVAIAAAYLIFKIGFAVTGAFARPVPDPPPPGELRKVKLTYRCSSCGAELRMTLANDQVPQSPRHCADEMDLLTAPEDV